MERITSRQNATVRRFRELARSGGKSTSTEILLDGGHLLEEALACAIPVEVAAFVDRELDRASSQLAHLAMEVRRQGGRVLSVTDSVLAAMSPVQQPSGVVAIGHTEPSPLANVFSEHAFKANAKIGRGHTRTNAEADVSGALVLVLAGLQDPGNVGAIIRTAAASGATGVAAIEGTANPFGWKALRGGMGGTFRIPISTRGSLLDAITTARNANVQLLAAVPRDGTPLPQVDFRGPTAVIFGGEGAGISETVVAAADGTVTIPMRRPVESLNVSTAAAVILYEASRQRDARTR